MTLSLFAIINISRLLSRIFLIVLKAWYIELLFGHGGCKTKKWISLCQRYALDVLEDADFLGTKSVLFPMDKNLKLGKLEGDLPDNPSLCRLLIG